MSKSRRMCSNTPVSRFRRCNIAQVKQKYGIIERECYNKPKSEDAKQPQCPPDKEVAIVEALKFYGLIAPCSH